MKIFSNIQFDFDFRLPNDQKLLDEFKKPIFENRFFISKNSLIKNSKIVKLNKNIWDKNPFKFSLDMYDNSLFAHVILLVNDLSSYSDFNSDTIIDVIVPNKQTISKIIENI